MLLQLKSVYLDRAPNLDLRSLIWERDRTLYLIANFYCIYILLYISLLELILGIAISG